MKETCCSPEITNPYEFRTRFMIQVGEGEFWGTVVSLQTSSRVNDFSLSLSLQSRVFFFPPPLETNVLSFLNKICRNFGSSKPRSINSAGLREGIKPYFYLEH